MQSVWIQRLVQEQEGEGGSGCLRCPGVTRKEGHGGEAGLDSWCETQSQ